MRITTLVAAAAALAYAPLVTARAAAQPAPPPRYVVTELIRWNNPSWATAINNYGQVTFNVADDTVTQGVVWTPRVRNGTDGTYTGGARFGADETWRNEAINDSGVVVGSSYDPHNFPFARATLFTPGTPNGGSGAVRDFGLSPMDSNSSAYGVNNRGQVALELWPAERPGPGAVLWTPDAAGSPAGSFTSLGELPGRGWTRPAAINNFGQVVGTASPGTSPGEPGVRAGFLWTPSAPGATAGAMFELDPALRAPGLAVEDISDAGAVVGWVGGRNRFTPSSAARGFIWTPATPNGSEGTLRFIDGSGPAGSGVYDINDLGQAVGDLGGRAFVWDVASGEGFDVNSLLDPDTGRGWVIQQGHAINDLGQIAALGAWDPVGDGSTWLSGMVLLTPVPEPGPAAALAVAASVVTLRRRRR